MKQIATWLTAAILFLTAMGQASLGAEAAKQIDIVGPDKPVPVSKTIVLPVTGLGATEVPLILWPKTNKAAVHWALLSPSQSLCAIFQATEIGRYTVLVVGTSNDYDGCTIVVRRPDPDPEPDPDPTPGPRFVLIVHESAERTVEMVVSLGQLRSYLEGKQHSYRFEDKDLKDAATGQPAVWLQPYLRKIKTAKLKLPVIVVDGDGDRQQGFDEIYIEAMPGTGVKAIEIVKKYGG